MVENILVESSGHECDVRIDTWLKDLLPRTPGINRKVAKRELLLAIREFYEQSASWRVVVGPRDSRANKRRYILSPYDAYANIVQVLSVEYMGYPLKALTRRPAGAEPNADRPTSFYLEDPDHVRVWPTPSTTVEDALTFHVALTPKMSVTHVPRLASTNHYDALLDGALGRIYSHPAKPYSNPSLGTYHLQRFRAAIGKYAGRAKTGYAGAASWQYPRYGK
jgi:hypothetical protein